MIAFKIASIVLVFFFGNSLYPIFEYDRAVAAFSKGDGVTAQKQLEIAMMDSFDRPDLLYDAGVIAAAQEQHEQAKNYFDLAASCVTDTTPSDLEQQILFNAGNSCVACNKLQEAIQRYDAVLARNKDHEYALHNKKIVEEMLKKQQEQEQENQKKEEEKQEQENKDDQQSDSKESNNDQKNNDQEGNQNQDNEKNSDENTKNTDSQNQNGDEQNQKNKKSDDAKKSKNSNQKQSDESGSKQKNDERTKESDDLGGQKSQEQPQDSSSGDTHPGENESKQEKKQLSAAVERALQEQEKRDKQTRTRISYMNALQHDAENEVNGIKGLQNEW